MRRWLAKAFLLAPLLSASLSIAAYGAEPKQVQVIGPFGGLNNVDTSYTIPANKSPDLLNVDITPGGKSIKKRSGYGVTWTLSNSTSGLRGVYGFFNQSGASVELYFNDRNLSTSIDGATPTVIFSTGPNQAYYQCIDGAGFAYCANTDRTSIIKTDGTSDTTITTMRSTGTLLAITPERLVHADFSEDLSRIDFSKANDFSEWRLGSNPEDPISFTIVAPGAKITHLVYAHGRIYWFKTNSFGYILEGSTHDDWIARTLSSDVGTLFNTSVFRDDILYFQGQDSHWYAWDGSNLQKLSRDVDAEISTALNQVSNSFTQTSASDFNSGSLLPSSVYVDTDTTAGSIQMTFPDGFSVFRDGSGGTKNVWSKDVHTNGTIQVNNGNLDITNQSALGSEPGITSQQAISGFVYGTTISITVNSLPPDTSGSERFYFGIAPTKTAFEGFQDGSTPNQIFGSWQPTSSGLAEMIQVYDSDNNYSMSLTTSIPFTIDLCIHRNFYNFTVNKSSSFFSRSVSFSNDSNYVYAGVLLSESAVTPKTVSIDNFTVVPQTITYRSVVNNAPDITTWGTLDVTKQDGGGTHTNYMRSSNSSFAVSDAAPSWTQVTAGQPISIATGSYFQFRNDFLITFGTQTPRMDDFTINWSETTTAITPSPTYAIYHDDSLWWSVKSGAGVTTNNRIFKLDLINNEWFKYDIPINGFLIRNKNLYFGGVSTGTINQFGSANSDAGSAINAYWKSRDFFGDSPFLDKDFWRMSFVAGGESGSNMDVTYTINGSTATSYQVPISRGSDLFVKRNVNFPLGTAGSTINFQFGNNAADAPFELFGGQLEYTDRRWNPQDD